VGVRAPSPRSLLTFLCTRRKYIAEVEATKRCSGSQGGAAAELTPPPYSAVFDMFPEWFLRPLQKPQSIRNSSTVRGLVQVPAVASDVGPGAGSGGGDGGGGSGDDVGGSGGGGVSGGGDPVAQGSASYSSGAGGSSRRNPNPNPFTNACALLGYGPGPTAA
jgi:hypothetical protein